MDLVGDTAKWREAACGDCAFFGVGSLTQIQLSNSFVLLALEVPAPSAPILTPSQGDSDPDSTLDSDHWTLRVSDALVPLSATMGFAAGTR